MKTATDLKIDPEFQKNLRILSDEEFNSLKEQLARFGCLDTIKTWNGIIIDGHNRFLICEELGIEFRTEPLEFDDREAVIQWMIRNQLARRNLHPTEQAVLIGRLFNSRKKSIGNPQINQLCHRDTIGEAEGVTRDEVAKETGKSARTVTRDAVLAEAIDRLPEEISAPILAEKVKLPRTEIIALPDKTRKEQRAILDAAKKKPRKKPPKANGEKPPKKTGLSARDLRVAGINNKLDFDDKLIDTCFGQLIRAVDKRAAALKCKDGAHHKKAIKNLGVFLDDFRIWQKERR